MSDWSAQQYLKFEDERTRAARDLLAQVPLVEARRIVDIGCGPGNSTELLVKRWPQAIVSGIDTSAGMLRQARERLPGLNFVETNVSHWVPKQQTDVLFANAVFQWVPDHIRQLKRLLGALPLGGVLAVQMPDNLAEPSHELMRETAKLASFQEPLAAAAGARDVLPSPRTYYDELKRFCTHLDIWHTVYNHVLDNPAAVVEWVKGTGLRPFLDPLKVDDRKAFLKEYEARIAQAYPPMHDGRVMLRFPRVFIVAIR